MTHDEYLAAPGLGSSALNALNPNQPPGMAKGGQPSVEQMKAELAEKKTKKPKSPFGWIKKTLKIF